MVARLLFKSLYENHTFNFNPKQIPNIHSTTIPHIFQCRHLQRKSTSIFKSKTSLRR